MDPLKDDRYEFVVQRGSQDRFRGAFHNRYYRKSIIRLPGILSQQKFQERKNYWTQKGWKERERGREGRDGDDDGEGRDEDGPGPRYFGPDSGLQAPVAAGHAAESHEHHRDHDHEQEDEGHRVLAARVVVGLGPVGPRGEGGDDGRTTYAQRTRAELITAIWAIILGGFSALLQGNSYVVCGHNFVPIG